MEYVNWPASDAELALLRSSTNRRTSHGSTGSVPIYTQLLFAAFMLVVAGGVWFVFLRPVPTYQAAGSVTAKTYQVATTYWQYHAGDRQGFRAPTPIPIADGFVLAIAFENSSRVAQVSVNSTEARKFEVGTKVQFEYCVRGLPPFWARIYILSIAPNGVKP